EGSRVVIVLLDGGVAVFALVGRRDLPTELMSEQLHAVADAEHRKLLFEHPGGNHGRVDVVDARRAAGQDDTLRPELRDLLPRSVMRHQFAVDATLADATGDEHRILRAEVDDDDGFRLCRNAGRRLPWRFAA